MRGGTKKSAWLIVRGAGQSLHNSRKKTVGKERGEAVLNQNEPGIAREKRTCKKQKERRKRKG